MLILDEATSGLDTVIRYEILDMFLDFIQDEEHSVLISSHITSDLEKVADYITFIHKGEVFLSEEKDRIMENYGIVHCRPEDQARIEPSLVIAVKQTSYDCQVMVNARELVIKAHPEWIVDKIKLEDILLFKVKEEN